MQRAGIVLLAWLTFAGYASQAPAPVSAGVGPGPAQLIGQKLMVAMSGTTPDSDLLGRVGRGEVGGVILFGSNITTASALVALTAELQRAAAAGGQPPLLIATDQEGGSVKRVPWAPPTLSPPQMGNLGSASSAFAQGKATGLGLLCAGVNNDLAPVADVPASTASFMYQEGRTWSFDASLTATLSDAFASGLEAGGAIAGDEALPRDRPRDAQHRHQCGDDPRFPIGAGSGPAALCAGDRPSHPADHALQRDVPAYDGATPRAGRRRSASACCGTPSDSKA